MAKIPEQSMDFNKMEVECAELTATGNVTAASFTGASGVLGAYTQTYSTAARTVPAAVTAITGGEAPTEAEHNLLVADVLALKKVITAIIDDLQSLGFVG